MRSIVLCVVALLALLFVPVARAETQPDWVQQVNRCFVVVEEQKRLQESGKTLDPTGVQEELYKANVCAVKAVNSGAGNDSNSQDFCTKERTDLFFRFAVGALGLTLALKEEYEKTKNDPKLQGLATITRYILEPAIELFERACIPNESSEETNI